MNKVARTFYIWFAVAGMGVLAAHEAWAQTEDPSPALETSEPPSSAPPYSVDPDCAKKKGGCPPPTYPASEQPPAASDAPPPTGETPPVETPAAGDAPSQSPVQESQPSPTPEQTSAPPTETSTAPSEPPQYPTTDAQPAPETPAPPAEAYGAPSEMPTSVPETAMPSQEPQSQLPEQAAPPTEGYPAPSEPPQYPTTEAQPAPETPTLPAEAYGAPAETQAPAPETAMPSQEPQSQLPEQAAPPAETYPAPSEPPAATPETAGSMPEPPQYPTTEAQPAPETLAPPAETYGAPSEMPTSAPETAMPSQEPQSQLPEQTAPPAETYPALSEPPVSTPETVGSMPETPQYPTTEAQPAPESFMAPAETYGAPAETQAPAPETAMPGQEAPSPAAEQSMPSEYAVPSGEASTFAAIEGQSYQPTQAPAKPGAEQIVGGEGQPFPGAGAQPAVEGRAPATEGEVVGVANQLPVDVQPGAEAVGGQAPADAQRPPDVGMQQAGGMVGQVPIPADQQPQPGEMMPAGAEGAQGFGQPFEQPVAGSMDANMQPEPGIAASAPAEQQGLAVGQAPAEAPMAVPAGMDGGVQAGWDAPGVGMGAQMGQAMPGAAAGAADVFGRPGGAVPAMAPRGVQPVLPAGEQAFQPAPQAGGFEAPDIADARIPAEREIAGKGGAGGAGGGGGGGVLFDSEGGVARVDSGAGGGNGFPAVAAPAAVKPPVQPPVNMIPPEDQVQRSPEVFGPGERARRVPANQRPDGQLDAMHLNADDAERARQQGLRERGIKFAENERSTGERDAIKLNPQEAREAREQGLKELADKGNPDAKKMLDEMKAERVPAGGGGAAAVLGAGMAGTGGVGAAGVGDSAGGAGTAPAGAKIKGIGPFDPEPEVGPAPKPPGPNLPFVAPCTASLGPARQISGLPNTWHTATDEGPNRNEYEANCHNAANACVAQAPAQHHVGIVRCYASKWGPGATGHTANWAVKSNGCSCLIDTEKGLEVCWKASKIPPLIESGPGMEAAAWACGDQFNHGGTKCLPEGQLVEEPDRTSCASTIARGGSPYAQLIAGRPGAAEVADTRDDTKGRAGSGQMNYLDDSENKLRPCNDCCDNRAELWSDYFNRDPRVKPDSEIFLRDCKDECAKSFVDKNFENCQKERDRLAYEWKDTCRQAEKGGAGNLDLKKQCWSARREYNHNVLTCPENEDEQAIMKPGPPPTRDDDDGREASADNKAVDKEEADEKRWADCRGPRKVRDDDVSKDCKTKDTKEQEKECLKAEIDLFDHMVNCPVSADEDRNPQSAAAKKADRERQLKDLEEQERKAGACGDTKKRIAALEQDIKDLGITSTVGNAHILATDRRTYIPDNLVTKFSGCCRLNDLIKAAEEKQKPRNWYDPDDKDHAKWYAPDKAWDELLPITLKALEDRRKADEEEMRELRVKCPQ